MQITRVQIERFRAIDTIDLRFADELGDPQTVVTMAGPNGSGKTSVLYAITNALRGVFGYRTDDVPDPNLDDIRTTSSSGGGWSKKPRDIQVSVSIHFGDEEQEDIRETLNLLGKEPPPDLPDGTLTVQWTFPPRVGPDGQRQPWHFSDIIPAVPNVRSWLQVKSWAINAWRKQEVTGASKMLPKLGGLHFFPQDRDLKNRVVGAASGPDDESDDRRPTRFQRPSVHDVLNAFHGMFSRVPEEDPGNWESHVKRLYKTVCDPKEYLGFRYRDDRPLGTPVFDDQGYEYPLSHAASGEHVILEYIIELSRFGPLNRSIVLIDEPEVHLHPLWLRRLYLSLPDFGADNQFILTTHSPELRERAAADNALIETGDLDQEK